MQSDWQNFCSLCQILGGRSIDETFAQIEKPEDWKSLIWQSSWQRVIPTLGWLITQHSPPSLPSDDRQFLEEVLAANAERNQAITVQTCEIVEALNKSEVRPVVLKGTASLLCERFPHPGYRMQQDIDLLVSPDEILTAVNVLQQLGYVAGASIESDGGTVFRPVSDSQQPVLQRQYAQSHHLPPMLRDGDVASIEIHRHAYTPGFQYARPLAGLFDRAKRVEKNGLVFKVLDDRDHLDLLVVGSYVSDRQKANHILPLRIAHEYLLLLDELHLQVGELESDFGQLFFHELSLALLRPNGQEVPGEVRRHIWVMEKMHAHDWVKHIVAQSSLWRRRVAHYLNDPLDVFTRMNRALAFRNLK